MTKYVLMSTGDFELQGKGRCLNPVEMLDTSNSHIVDNIIYNSREDALQELNKRKSHISYMEIWDGMYFINIYYVVSITFENNINNLPSSIKYGNDYIVAPFSDDDIRDVKQELGEIGRIYKDKYISLRDTLEFKDNKFFFSVEYFDIPESHFESGFDFSATPRERVWLEKDASFVAYYSEKNNIVLKKLNDGCYIYTNKDGVDRFLWYENACNAEILRDLLSLLNFSQKKFANEFQIPIRTVENWISEKTEIKDYILDLILYKARDLLSSK